MVAIRDNPKLNLATDLPNLEGCHVVLVKPNRTNSEGILGFSSEEGREGYIVGGVRVDQGRYFAGTRFRRGDVHVINGNRIILYGGCD